MKYSKEGGFNALEEESLGDIFQEISRIIKASVFIDGGIFAEKFYSYQSKLDLSNPLLLSKLSLKERSMILALIHDANVLVEGGLDFVTKNRPRAEDQGSRPGGVESGSRRAGCEGAWRECMRLHGNDEGFCGMYYQSCMLRGQGDPTDAVVVFEHAHYSGHFERLKVGNYPDMAVFGLDEKISAIKVPTGFAAQCFLSKNFGPPAQEFFRNHDDLTNSDSHFGQDTISSIRVRRV